LESQPPSNWQTWQTSLRATNAQATRKRIRMVAGVRNLPIASTIRFEIPIVESAVYKLFRNSAIFLFGFGRSCILISTVSGPSARSGTRNVFSYEVSG
jgi:hypothetical protein